MKDTLQSCGDSLKDAVENRSRDIGQTLLESVSSTVNAYGSALRKASEELDEKEEAWAANLTSDLAESLSQSASSIKESSPEDAVNYVNHQISLRPALALSGAFAAGLVLSRLLGARETESESEFQPRDGEGYATGTHGQI